ncbi:hypothetical protein BKA70DRAFT_1226019 [Coprinopsis sp. MPI-PUGE-AT-0042]|nr:hypothetical protein BKA70DRAFT_1226019 [Coprinopsis sp. MPI-PUGE-AT-0042]
MPKEPVASTTRVTRSRGSTPANSGLNLRYRQIKNPQNLRLSRGQRHHEDAPKVDSPSETSMEEGEVFDAVSGQADAEILGIEESSDSASDLLAITKAVERQKRQLQLKTSTLRRRNKEIKALKERIAELDEEVQDKESMLDQSQKNEVQYRNWWLNEIQFTKLLLNKIPNPNRDVDLVRTSQAHYLGHY